VATRAGEVLAESGQGSHQDVPKSGRVFRVIICEACGWQYGAWWLNITAPGYWGNCPKCGCRTTVGTSFLPERRSAAAVPAQQELAL